MALEGRALVFGRVHFKSRESAEAAKEKMNGAMLLDSKLPIKVEWYQTPSARRPTIGRSIHYKRNMSKYESSPIVSIYVQFEGTAPDYKVSDEILLDAFSQFGNVTLVCIKSTTVVNFIETGYAFVHFDASDEGRNAAMQAVESSPIHDHSSGYIFRVEFSRNFEKSATPNDVLPYRADGSFTSYGFPDEYIPEDSFDRQVSTTFVDYPYPFWGPSGYPYQAYVYPPYAPTGGIYYDSQSPYYFGGNISQPDDIAKYNYGRPPQQHSVPNSHFGNGNGSRGYKSSNRTDYRMPY